MFPQSTMRPNKGIMCLKQAESAHQPHLNVLAVDLVTRTVHQRPPMNQMEISVIVLYGKNAVFVASNPFVIRSNIRSEQFLIRFVWSETEWIISGHVVVGLFKAMNRISNKDHCQYLRRFNLYVIAKCAFMISAREVLAFVIP